MTPASYEADMREFEKIDALKKDLYCANVLIDGYRARVKELELNKSEPHKCLEMAAYVAKEHLHSNNIAAAIRCLESGLSESNAQGDSLPPQEENHGQ